MKPLQSQNGPTRRTILRSISAGGVIPLIAQDDGGSRERSYEEIRDSLQTMRDPWRTSASDVSWQMTATMMETAKHLAQGAAMPMSLPHEDIADIALAFAIGMDLIQQGQAAVDREDYRTRAKTMHSSGGILMDLYDDLPHTSYDNQKPYDNLIWSASRNITLYLQGNIDENELASRMGTLYSIFELLWSAIENAKDTTSSSWQPQETTCITVDGEEICENPDDDSDDDSVGDPYYNSLRFVLTMTDALRTPRDVGTEESDTEADYERIIQPGTRLLFEVDIENPDGDWDVEWQIDGERAFFRSHLGAHYPDYLQYVEQYEVDYYNHTFESTGSYDVTAFVFSDPTSDTHSRSNPDYDQAEATRWIVHVRSDGKTQPSVTAAEPDPDEPITVDRDESFEVSLDISSPDSGLDRVVWWLSQADIILGFHDIDGNEQSVTLSVEESCHTCKISPWIITEDGLLTWPDSWEIDHMGDPTIAVTITDTNTPIDAGEFLEVEAEIENNGDESTTQEIELIVGHDPERLDSASVSVDPGDTETITLGYETPLVDNDQEFPVRVESENDSDEQSVLVYGTQDGDSSDDTSGSGAFTVSIVGTNTPVDAGEFLEVTAQVEHTGSPDAPVTRTVRLIVGHTPEQVDSQRVTLSPSATQRTQTISLGYQTPLVDNDQEFPVRVETESDSDEQSVLVYGTD